MTTQRSRDEIEDSALEMSALTLDEMSKGDTDTQDDSGQPVCELLRFCPGLTASGRGEAPKGQRLRHPETVEIDAHYLFTVGGSLVSVMPRLLMGVPC